MKKEDEQGDNWISLVFGNVFNIVKEFLMQGVMSKVDEQVDSIMVKFSSTLEEFEKRFMQDFTIRVISLAGMFFIFLGLIFGLTDIVGIQRTYAFLFTGAVILVVAVFVRKYVDIKNRLEAQDGSQEKT